MESGYEYPAPTRLAGGNLSGSVTLVGWQRDVLRVQPEDDDIIEVTTEGDLIRVSGHGDITFYLPSETPVSIESVSGDLNVRNLVGSLQVGAVHGDVAIVQVTGNISMTSVSGDITASNVMGSFDLNQVAGDVRAQRISGDVTLRNVQAGVELEMVRGRISATGTGQITGDTVIRHSAGEVTLGALDGDLHIAHHEGGVTVREVVHGDLRLEDLQGVITLTHVQGDVVGSRIRGLTASNIDGDMRIDQTEGPITVKHINGDVKLQRCAGLVTLTWVGGDVTVREAAQGIRVEDIMGDASVITTIANGQQYQVTANGDLTFAVQGNCNARFVAKATNGEIHSTLPLALEKGKRQNLVGVIGQPSAAVVLISRNGDISLRSASERHEQPLDGAPFTRAVSDAVFLRIGHRLNRAERFAARTVGSAMEKAETEMRGVVNGALERARNVPPPPPPAPPAPPSPPSAPFGWKGGSIPSFGWKGAPWASTPTTPESEGEHPAHAEPAAAPTPARTPADTSEQRSILEMVRSGTISPDDGVKLLEALSGKR